MKRVYCVGLAVVDVPLRPVPRGIFDLDRARIEAPVWSVGGDAANVAAALAKMGVSVTLSCIVGRDIYGEFIARRLGEAGVDMSGLRQHPTLPTGIAHILIEPEGERHFLTLLEKAHDELAWEHLCESYIKEADYVFFGSCMSMKLMDGGGTAKLFETAKRLGKTTLVDFGGNVVMRGDYYLGYYKDMLAHCDILLPSLGQAKMLAGEETLSGIRAALAGRGAGVLAVKQGALGCYLTDFEREWNIPAFTEFTPVDLTGAGDSFVAGFIRGLIEGWDIATAATFACCVAGHNITRVGATAGVTDFEAMLRYAQASGRLPLK